MTLTPPSKPWLNKDWREYVLSLANEVEQLRAEALLFRHNMSDTYGGSGGSVATSRTFPAVISGSSGGFLPLHTKFCDHATIPGQFLQVTLPKITRISFVQTCSKKGWFAAGSKLGKWLFHQACITIRTVRVLLITHALPCLSQQTP